MPPWVPRRGEEGGCELAGPVRIVRLGQTSLEPAVAGVEGLEGRLQCNLAVAGCREELGWGERGREMERESVCGGGRWRESVCVGVLNQRCYSSGGFGYILTL